MCKGLSKERVAQKLLSSYCSCWNLLLLPNHTQAQPVYLKRDGFFTASCECRLGHLCPTTSPSLSLAERKLVI